MWDYMGGTSLVFQGGMHVFHGVLHERALPSIHFCTLQRYYPTITITWLFERLYVGYVYLLLLYTYIYVCSDIVSMWLKNFDEFL
jgi:hypothetical protein